MSHNSFGGIGLTNAEITQLKNIDNSVISSTEWGHVANMDQDVSTTSNVSFNSVQTPTIFGGTIAGVEITGSNVSQGKLWLRSTSNAAKGYVLLDEETDASNTTSGAMVLYGGLGVAKNIYANRVYGSYFDIQSVEQTIGANQNYILATGAAGNGAPYVASQPFEIVSWTFSCDGDKTTGISADRWYAGNITIKIWIGGIEDTNGTITGMTFDDANLSTYDATAMGFPTLANPILAVYRTYIFSSPIQVNAGQSVDPTLSTSTSFLGSGPECQIRLNCFTR